MKKGIDLPVNSIIIIALSLIVLVGVAAFFLSSMNPSKNDIDANSYFYQTCPTLRCTNSRANFDIARTLSSDNPDFIKSCRRLFPETNGIATDCMQKCGCDFTVTQGAVQNNINNFANEVQNNQFP